jgi:hypothetical protein
MLFSLSVSGPLTPTQTRSTQHSAPSTPGRSEMFPQVIWTPVLSGEWWAICRPGALEYVVPSRVDDVLHSPGRVAVALSSEVAGSLYTNYGRSRMSHMLARFILHFPVLHF